MDRLTRLREAIKAALALALVYGIAMKAGWLNPSWAALAVAMIALPTGGQSIHKGVLRLAGTIPGCIAALAIYSVAPQNRWGFILLVCTWVLLMTYMMLADKGHAYFWNVAGFVCLIITLTGPSSSAKILEHAVFRTVETAMGIVVYTLITVFLWPRTNAGAIKKASAALVATQAELWRAGHGVITGQGGQANLPELRTRQIQQLDQLAQALQAEGSESFEVHELRHLWRRFQALSTDVMQVLDRWQAGFTELALIEVNKAFPGLQALFTEMDGRFEEIRRVLGGQSPAREPRVVSLDLDPAVFRGLSFLDQSALAVTRKELQSLDVLTRSMFECACDLADHAADKPSARIPSPRTRSPSWRVPVPDLDHLRGALFAAATVGVGFLIWILFDPPGHAGWFEFPGIIAMAVAATQQLKATMFLKPVALAMTLGLAAYVFIMPQLSTFVGLGSLLFLSMFVVCYFFSGIARLAGIIGIITGISVQNQQTYDFAALANSALFILLGFAFVFGMSYMIRSPRPEKAVLHLMRRFFRSTGFLISQVAVEHGRTPPFLQRWKTAFHVREMQALPAKLAAWGKAIDRKKFPGNTPEQLQAMVTSLKALGCRMEQLLEAGHAGQADSIMDDLRDDLGAWRREIGQTFARWSSHPEAQPEEDLRHGMETRLVGLEAQLARTAARPKGSVTREEGESFYRLLGGYRGVSEAAIAYAGVAGGIDWVHWREESF